MKSFIVQQHRYIRATETARLDAEITINMKKLLLIIISLAILSGCAAQTYRSARANANNVKNGMTVAEASQILGMQPTHALGDRVQWRRGNAQKYTGAHSGAIEFRVVDGRIVDVPDGGIFSPAALAKINAEWLRERQADDAARAQSDEEQAERDRIAAAERKLQEEKDQEQRDKDIAAEVAARENAAVRRLSRAPPC